MSNPYPEHYVHPWKLNDGTEVVIRPIRPDDEPLMVWFHETLSDETVYMRYFHPMKLSKRVSHDRLTQICNIDYETEMVLVAECETPSPREVEIVAVARMNKLPNSKRAETALVVSDNLHGKGLGTEMLRYLIDIARDMDVDFLSADMLPENDHVKHVYTKLGFTRKFDHEEGVVHAQLDIRPDHQKIDGQEISGTDKS